MLVPNVSTCSLVPKIIIIITGHMCSVQCNEYRRTRITHTHSCICVLQAQPERRRRDKLLYFFCLLSESYLFVTDTLIRQSKRARCACLALNLTFGETEETGNQRVYGRKMSGRLAILSEYSILFIINVFMCSCV